MLTAGTAADDGAGRSSYRSAMSLAGGDIFPLNNSRPNNEPGQYRG